MDLRRLVEQFLKFGVVGVIAFIIDFGLLWILTEFAHMDPVLSAAISFMVSLIFNYLASMRYVFSHRTDISRRQEFLIFCVLSAVGLAINELIMWAGVSYTPINYLVIKVFATALVTIWNFFSRKRWLDASDGGYELEPPLDEELDRSIDTLVDRRTSHGHGAEETRPKP